jgi:hypothetical protein
MREIPWPLLWIALHSSEWFGVCHADVCLRVARLMARCSRFYAADVAQSGYGRNPEHGMLSLRSCLVHRSTIVVRCLGADGVVFEVDNEDVYVPWIRLNRHEAKATWEAIAALNIVLAAF